MASLRGTDPRLIDTRCLIGLARRRQYSDLLKSLALSVFRRWFRLMLPALVSSFLFFLLARCGWATKLPAGWDVNQAPVSEPLFDSTDLTLSAWVADVLFLTNPFRFGEVSFPKYNYPLWTMPVEYMGSMVIYIVIIATALVRPLLRLVVLAALVVYCMWMGRWEWCLFISGVFLADVHNKSTPEPASILMPPLTSRIDEVVEENAGYKNSREGWTKYFKPYTKTFPKPSAHIVDSFLFLLALYFGSVPTGNPADLSISPGYGWLSPWVPRSWGFYIGSFYPDIGAMLLVSVLARSKFLQKIFTTRIAQYLGDISLSLYILHVLVLHTLGNWLIVQCSTAMRPLGSWGFMTGISSQFIYYNSGARLTPCSSIILLCNRDHLPVGYILAASRYTMYSINKVVGCHSFYKGRVI